MDRREFLKTLALTGAAVTMKWDGVMDIMAQNTSQAGGCDLVAVMGGEPAEMFRKAIAEFGGMGKFVKAGQKVDEGSTIDLVVSKGAKKEPEKTRERSSKSSGGSSKKNSGKSSSSGSKSSQSKQPSLGYQSESSSSHRKSKSKNSGDSLDSWGYVN